MRLTLLLTLCALFLSGCLSSDMHPPEWYNWYSIKPYSPVHKTPGYRPPDEKRPRSDRRAFFFFYSLFSTLYPLEFQFRHCFINRFHCWRG